MAKEKQLVECVPNFSEGRNPEVIHQITEAISQCEGVKLLNVDPGEDTNRTVVTFVGEPSAVCDAALRAVKTACALIDMRQHHGAHPRIGATDVLPLVPVRGITLEECAELARRLAERIADEAKIPCYCYEAAALKPERRNLSFCRRGEYEAIPEKLADPERRPDYGYRPMDEGIARTGCTVVGARDFLIAVNFNLNTTSTRRANAIAFDVREKGRPVREGNPITGPKKLDADGNVVMRPGTLKGTKAIGWFIEEYGVAQVSMNITNMQQTPLHVAFEEVSRCARNRGLRVTGTEIVGLIPERALLDAGRYFLKKQQRSVGIPKEDILQIAIKSMGLDELRPFDPQEKVIEYLLEKDADKPLTTMTIKGFADETLRESTAPGGGSVAAYMGALGASLGGMVANLSAHKPGWDDRWEHFSDWAEQGAALQQELLQLVDEDTAAFQRLMTVFRLPKGSDEERRKRAEAIEEATLYAAQVPLRTMKVACRAFPLCRAMAEEGVPASLSDAGVAALAIRGAVLGAAMNVKINAKSLKDKQKAEALIAEVEKLKAEALAAEKDILNIVDNNL